MVQVGVTPSSNLGADIFTGVAYENSTWIVAPRTGVVYRSTDEGATWTNPTS